MNRGPGAEKSFLTALLSAFVPARTRWEKKQLFDNIWVVSLENRGHFEICQSGMCLSPWEKTEYNDRFNSYEEYFPGPLTHLMSYN